MKLSSFISAGQLYKTINYLWLECNNTLICYPKNNNLLVVKTTTELNDKHITAYFLCKDGLCKFTWENNSALEYDAELFLELI